MPLGQPQVRVDHVDVVPAQRFGGIGEGELRLRAYRLLGWWRDRAALGVSSTCWTLRWRSGPSPVTVPASTMDSTHEASSSSRLAGGVAAYRSTRPVGRAAAMAAPGPMAAVQRTDSASAPS